MSSRPRIGVAGWNIHKSAAALFPALGSHLARYAAVFNAVEINSSFYREHRVASYQRWAASVPPDFRFSAKVPKEITHVRRLVACEALIDAFVAGPAALGDRAGPLIVQLPPSLALDPAVAERFFAAFRARWRGPLVCEPRHSSWFDGEGDALLTAHRVGRVGADPACVPAAAEPGGSPDTIYWRLHGSPRTYYSAYPPDVLTGIARAVERAAARSREVWCIFDNTALGEAARDAGELVRLLRTPAGK